MDGLMKMNGFKSLASNESDSARLTGPKMSVCGKDEEGRAESPVSSCLSLKSDHSKDIPLAFGNDPGLLDT
ncbi:hypothetical protein FQN60_001912, partial [Etheostoma spectabile]